MVRTFTFGGKTSSDFGIYIDAPGIYKSPRRIVESIVIPGRNGTLTKDGKCFENVQLIYNCYIKNEAPQKIKLLQEHLLSEGGYRKLEDDYETDCYRMARCFEEIDFDVLSIGFNAGTFKLTFDCMPQRFLKSGDRMVTILKGNNHSFVNPSNFTSLPFIRVYGSGALDIGDIRIEIKHHTEPYIDIDCETRQCTYGLKRMGEFVSISGHRFPSFSKDETNVVCTGVDKAEITPRWWKI